MEKLLELWHTTLGKVIACLLAIALAFMGWNIAMIMGAFGSDDNQTAATEDVATEGDESSTPESADDSSSSSKDGAADSASVPAPAEKDDSSTKETSSASAAVSADEDAPADDNADAEGDKAQGSENEKDSAAVDSDENKDAAENGDEKADASKDSDKAEAKDEEKTEQPKVDNEGVVAKGVDAPEFEGYAYVTKGAVFGIFGGTQVTVKVSADEGVVPQGTTVEATLIDPSEYAQLLEDAGLESATATLVDINLVYEGSYIQPNGAVNVSIFDPDVALPAEGGELQVVHIADTSADHEAVDASQIINPAGSESGDEVSTDEGAATDEGVAADEPTASEPEAITVETRQADDSCVSFDTEHFSIYAVAASTKTVTVNATVKNAVVKMVSGRVPSFAADGRPNVEGAEWSSAVDAQDAGTLPLTEDTAFLFFVKGDSKSVISSFNTTGSGNTVHVFPLNKQVHWHGIDQLCADAVAEGYVAYFGYTLKLAKAASNTPLTMSIAGTVPTLDMKVNLSKTKDLVPGEKVDATITVTPQKKVNGVSFDVSKPQLASLTIGGRTIDISDLDLVETSEGSGVYTATYKDYPVSLDDVRNGVIQVSAEAKTQYDYGMTLGGGGGNTTDIVTTTMLDGSASATAAVAPKAGVSYAYSYQDGMRPSADVENAMLEDLPAGSDSVYNSIAIAANPDPAKYHDEGLHGTWSFEGWKKDGSGDVLLEGSTLPVSGSESTIYIVGNWSFTPDYVVTWVSEGTTVSTQYYWDETGHDSLVVPSDPSKNADDEYDYAFTGWADGSGNAAPAAGSVVAESATYYAQYTAAYRPLLTIKYVDESGNAMKGVDTYSKRLGSGEAYKVASPRVDGYDANPWVVAGTMGSVDVEETVVYRHKKPVNVQHMLTVRYVYDDGTEAAASHAEALAEGKKFTVKSPLIEGYDADKPVVAGTMGSGDYEVIVTYRPKTPVVVAHFLTIHYVKADGSKAAEDYQATLNENDAYDVASPFVSGYDADRPVVAGTMGAEDREVTVVYHPKTPVAIARTLTIHYVYTDGSKALDDHVETLKKGDAFDVSSPAKDGYKPSFTKIGGTMPDHDVELTVVYTAINPNPNPNPNPGTTDPGTNPGGTNDPGTDNPGGSTDNPGTNPGGTDNPGTNPGGGTDNPGTTDPGTDNPGTNPGGNTDNPGTGDDNGNGNNTPNRPGTTAVVIPGGASNPVYPIVQTLGTPVAVDDNPNPLAGNATSDEGNVTFIDDDGNALMTVDSCWVHFYMIIGLILTALYGLGVIGRRRAYAGSINKLVDGVVNKSEK